MQNTCQKQVTTFHTKFKSSCRHEKRNNNNSDASIQCSLHSTLKFSNLSRYPAFKFYAELKNSEIFKILFGGFFIKKTSDIHWEWKGIN